MDAPKTGEFCHIGQSVVVKGDLSGSEDFVTWMGTWRAALSCATIA